MRTCRLYKCCLVAARRSLEQSRLDTNCLCPQSPHKIGGLLNLGLGLPLKAFLLSASAVLTANPSSSCTVFLIFTQMLNRWCDKLEFPLPTQSRGTPNYVQSSSFPHRIKTNQRAVNIPQIKSVAPVRRQDVSLHCHSRSMKMRAARCRCGRHLMLTLPSAAWLLWRVSSCSRSCDNSEMAEATGALQLAGSTTGSQQQIASKQQLGW